MIVGGSSPERVTRLVISEGVTINYLDIRISAGFPSPALDFSENDIDLIRELGLDKPSVYIMRVDGKSMEGKDIYIPNGAFISVDRSIKAVAGHVVLAILNQEFTIKTLLRKNGRYVLQPENPDFKPIIVSGDDELIIWGVVDVVFYRVGRKL